MTDHPSQDGVHDDPTNNRFVLEQEGATAELVYDTAPGRLVLLHTEVPDRLGGRGVGGELVRTALNHARQAQLTIVPWCAFARRWIDDHPDAARGVSIDWRAAPPAR